jgi:hypothetical protein
VNALGFVVAFVILVGLALLAPVFGADSRPGVEDPPELILRHRC